MNEAHFVAVANAGTYLVKLENREPNYDSGMILYIDCADVRDTLGGKSVSSVASRSTSPETTMIGSNSYRFRGPSFPPARTGSATDEGTTRILQQ